VRLWVYVFPWNVIPSKAELLVFVGWQESGAMSNKVFMIGQCVDQSDEENYQAQRTPTRSFPKTDKVGEIRPIGSPRRY
jgi:hypothetical protein